MRIVSWGFYLAAGYAAMELGLPFWGMLLVCGLMALGAACDVIASGGFR